MNGARDTMLRAALYGNLTRFQAMGTNVTLVAE